MKNANLFRRGRSCVFALHIHLVFVTKYRRKVFTKRVLRDLHTIFIDICKKMALSLEEFDGEKDHVHLLINYPPTQSISKLVNALKGASSRRIRKKGYVSISRALWGKNLWSPSYFAGSCGGASLAKIREYIESQQTPE